MRALLKKILGGAYCHIVIAIGSHGSEIWEHVRLEPCTMHMVLSSEGKNQNWKCRV